MAIKQVIRIRGLFNMSEAQRISVIASVKASYEDAEKRGVPLVVGDHCEVAVLDGVWEHHVQTTPAVAYDFERLMEERERDGWQVCSMAYHPGPIVFKRRVLRADDET